MSAFGGNGVVALVRRTSNVIADKPVRSIGRVRVRLDQDPAVLLDSASGGSVIENVDRQAERAAEALASARSRARRRAGTAGRTTRVKGAKAGHEVAVLEIVQDGRSRIDRADVEAGDARERRTS